MGLLATDVTSWAVVLSAVAAAVAAGASWASVRQSRRQWHASQVPDLLLDVVVNGATGEANLQVHNGGVVVARRVVACLVEAGQCFLATPPDHGSIWPGETIQAGTGTRLSDPRGLVKAAVICNDPAGNTHGWTVAGNHTTWTRGTLAKKQLSNTDILSELLDVSIQPDQIQLTRDWRVLRPTPDAP